MGYLVFFELEPQVKGPGDEVSIAGVPFSEGVDLVSPRSGGPTATPRLPSRDLAARGDSAGGVGRRGDRPGEVKELEGRGRSVREPTSGAPHVSPRGVWASFTPDPRDLKAWAFGGRGK